MDAYKEVDMVAIVVLILTVVAIVCGFIAYRAEKKMAPENRKSAVKLLALQILYWILVILFIVMNTNIYIFIG